VAETVMEVERLDELLDALEQSPELAEQYLRLAMQLSLLAIEGRVSVYPPATEANRPRPFVSGGGSDNRWYERGYGPRWARKDGTVGGRKTSRFLGRQWITQVNVVEEGIEGVMGNSTPYAEYVQGREQARFHARRGWLTLDDAVAQSEEDIAAAVSTAADKLLADLAD